MIDRRSVRKVFGKQSDTAIRVTAERGLGKTEVLKVSGCVVGAANASLPLDKGGCRATRPKYYFRLNN